VSTDKITNHFKMLRAVVDDAETAALAAASEHLHQLDSLRLEVSTLSKDLSRENADLSIQVMQLRHQLAKAGPADVVHLKEANGCLMAETMRLGAMLERKTTERDNAVAELARLADLDMMRLQMPDGYVAETIEQALRGWKAGYDTAFAAQQDRALENIQLRKQVATLDKQVGELVVERGDLEAELAHVRAELSAQMAIIEKATTEAAAANAWHADENTAHIGRLNNFVAAVDRAMGGDGCRAPEAVLSTAATLRLLAIEHQQNCSAARVVYANVDTSLSDPRPGKLLVVRIDEEDVDDMSSGQPIALLRQQFVGWLEAAQDEGDTETQPVDDDDDGCRKGDPECYGPADGRHDACLTFAERDRATFKASLLVRCEECTATIGHLGDCAKAVQP
jgi:hypothetical protein